ncbi:hypothetical protein [Marinitenerispora sediminis]|uniref:hypothetical protein n=1 Tax=Marinitenerispora sediminis TaxID=1931232 RepID=UPI0015F163D2|nr:hypothetical protein [Marinitenerispora sediminis]
MTAPADNGEVLLQGDTKASYFWDDGSGINGDTGAPASGEPMQQGMFASPSWPLGTKGYIEYEGQTVEFFIGDRGPGDPSSNCNVMLDLDGKTFAELVGGSWNESGLYVEGTDLGHINVTYHITEWGDGPGTPGAPHPMNDPSQKCESFVPESSDSGSDEAAAAAGEDQQAADEQQAAADEQQALEEKQDQVQEQAAQQQAVAKDQGNPAQESPLLTSTTASANAPQMATVAQELPMASGALPILMLLPVLLAIAIITKRKAIAFAMTRYGQQYRPALFTRENVRLARENLRRVNPFTRN